MWNEPWAHSRRSPVSRASAKRLTSTLSDRRPTRVTRPSASTISPWRAGAAKSIRSHAAVTNAARPCREAAMKATLSMCERATPPNSVPW